MKFLNSQQLAFILKIKKSDARDMMCAAWEKSKGIERKWAHIVGGVKIDEKTNKKSDPYPHAMPIDVLSSGLNLPDLQLAADDINKNYLTRSASRKFILDDFPRKKIESFKEEARQLPFSLKIPPALASMLPQKSQDEILKWWKEKHDLNLTQDEYREKYPYLV